MGYLNQGCFLSMDVSGRPNIKDHLSWTGMLMDVLDRTTFEGTFGLGQISPWTVGPDRNSIQTDSLASQHNHYGLSYFQFL